VITPAYHRVRSHCLASLIPREQLTTDLGVRGSTPLGRANLFKDLRVCPANLAGNRKQIGSSARESGPFAHPRGCLIGIPYRPPRPFYRDRGLPSLTRPAHAREGQSPLPPQPPPDRPDRGPEPGAAGRIARSSAGSGPIWGRTRDRVPGVSPTGGLGSHRPRRGTRIDLNSAIVQQDQ
jgi:hypothetical protein